MSELFECGDTGALVAYVYDECEMEVREAITAHAARCASCAAEIEGLGWAHQQLGAWTPPLAEVGFQMPVPSFERGLPWWRAPLPAWAQAAAAVLVFGAGLSIGLARAGVEEPASSQPSLATSADAASRSDLARMEQRLKDEMVQLRTSASVARQVAEVPLAARTGPAGEVTMQEVQSLVEQSEERQRREFTLRSVELARDVETQRRVDLASVRETLGQIQGVTGAEVRQQREAIDQINNYLIRVSQQGR